MFYHDEAKDKAVFRANVKKLQDVLNRSKMVIGHNLKFDMSWLFECNFTYEGRYFDTMIFEYMMAQGLKVALSLKETAKRYGTADKLDILDSYCSTGLNVNQVPLKALIEYGQQDIDTTWEVYQKQFTRLKMEPLTASMAPALKLMNEFLEVLIDVERNGIKVSLEALDKVEAEFKERHGFLEAKLKRLVGEVMGHTPVNLNSPEQMSQVLYSFKVIDKTKWAEIFNLGTEVRNGVSKKKYPKRFKDRELRAILNEHTTSIKRTRAEQCPACRGSGWIQLYCKDGSPRKNKNICHQCERSGLLYRDLPESAGFGLRPIGSEWASTGGFSSDKVTIDELLTGNLKDNAREFLEALKEYNAISTYLSSFVEGIRKNIRDDYLLHTNFNQCVTATGRLSSTRPNLQNQPRESTFPIRKVFVSRFIGGGLLNADFAQLEFRVAAYLAQCANAMADILAAVDVHRQTGAAVFSKAPEAITKVERDAAKPYTFRPLYGGTSGTEAQLKYFEYFFSHYDGIFKWHTRLMESALRDKYIQTPSGRVYSFPQCQAKKDGSVTFHTQIKNYPVQGFATGDILPVTMILIYRAMKKLKLKSKLCLTVHDSIVADTHPEEKEVLIGVFVDAFKQTIPDLKHRFNIDFNVPLGFDLEYGLNLLNKTKIKID